MKRIQLFEFEDFNWFPKPIRTGMTNLLVVLHKMFGTHEVLTKLITTVKKNYNFSKIIDLGSGSGGIMPEVIKSLNKEQATDNIKLFLTDLHPNANLVKRINNENEHISYLESSVNATNLNGLPNGLKTMVASFHHMPPEIAKSILKSAQDNKQPFLIYELAENKIPILLWWILLPLSLTILFIMSLFMTLFVKPFTWKQFLFTYPIPIIPICYAWDGQATLLRTYTFKDIEYLIQDFKDDSYTWEVSQAKKTNGKTLGYYVLGLPN